MKAGAKECPLYEVKDGLHTKVLVHHHIKQNLDNEIDDLQEGDWHRPNKQRPKGIKIGLKDHPDQLQQCTVKHPAFKFTWDVYVLFHITLVTMMLQVILFKGH